MYISKCNPVRQIIYVFEQRARAIGEKRRGSHLKGGRVGRFPGEVLLGLWAEYTEMRTIQPKQESGGRKQGRLGYSGAVPVHVLSQQERRRCV